MRHRAWSWILVAPLLVVAPATAKEPPAPRPKGARILGIHVSEASDGDFGRAYAHAKSVGLGVVGLSVAWDEIERAPGKFESKWLPIANAFYGPEQMPVSLVLKTLDTTQNRFPKDLRTRRMDDPVVVKRFTAFLDYVFTQIPQVKLTSLSLGNEIDGVLRADPLRWAQYTKLFEAGRAHVKKTRPHLAVGTTIMYSGHVGATKAFAQRINRTADVVLLTYYPLDAKMRVRAVGHVHEAFRQMTALYPEKPIHFGEIGCPSGKVVGSSPKHQAAFVTAMFAAWDRHAARVPLVSYCWLTDTSDDALDRYKKYYGSADPRFVDFLATLGLRSREGAGEDKPAFVALQEAATRRGFAPKR